MNEKINLKILRKKNHLTVGDMAQKLDICKAYYSLIENGKRRLYYDLAVEIAKIFELKPDDMFYQDANPYKKRN